MGIPLFLAILPLSNRCLICKYRHLQHVVEAAEFEEVGFFHMARLLASAHIHVVVDIFATVPAQIESFGSDRFYASGDGLRTGTKSL